MKMTKIILIAVSVLCTVLFSSTSSFAKDKIDILVDISSQRMYVKVNGVKTYTWKISTGRRTSWTHEGNFSVAFLSRWHRSSKYDNAPMPFAIFYDGDRAIHAAVGIGVKQIGSQASKGCVRLHPKMAAILFELVEPTQKSTTVVVQL